MKWTPDKVALLNEHWGKRSTKAIAAMLGCSVNAVRVRASASGLCGGRRRTLSTEEFTKAAIDGETINTLCLRVGCSHATVINAERQHGIKLTRSKRAEHAA